jgi:hypothetical protein
MNASFLLMRRVYQSRLLWERDPADFRARLPKRYFRLMSDRAHLETVCPNNHDLSVTLRRKEFEAALQSDTLVFHCNTCDTNWPPSREDIKKIREQFSKES